MTQKIKIEVNKENAVAITFYDTNRALLKNYSSYVSLMWLCEYMGGRWGKKDEYKNKEIARNK